MDPLPDKIKNLRGGKILDVATGYGDFLIFLTEFFKDYDEAVGIDSSANIIKAARKQWAGQLRFETMDAGYMRFPDDYFDTVAIRHSLHHLNHVNGVLKEMMRVLKPGGLLIICEVFQDPDTDYENAQRHLHHWWAAVDRTQGEAHYETMTKQEIFEIINRAGITDRDVFEYTPELDEDMQKKDLESMLQKCKIYLKKLRDAGDQDTLIAKGEKLIRRFKEQGFTTESALYILGHK
ncbi:MAG: methyltransferase domain-containing protein [candidate division Zixibacteria bacterium]|nr:methyltransferase domain-containing protein [candidate division Zixibacteria bacterium]